MRAATAAGPPLILATARSLWRDRIPGQLVIQFTDRCNAHCPQCGMRVTAGFERRTLSRDLLRRIVDAAAARGMQAVSFTGGEPLLHLDRLVDMLHHARRAGIRYTRTGTNGFVFRGADKPGFTARIQRLADTLAGTSLRNFWISLDSSEPELHEQMRGLPGVVRGIEKALPLFHAAGLYPSVNLGINRNVSHATRRLPPLVRAAADPGRCEHFGRTFRQAFGAFYRRAIDLGFTIVNSCYPMSVAPQDELAAVYAATSRDRVVSFSGIEKALLFEALMAAIPAYRGRIRIFSPRVSLLALQRQYTAGVKNVQPCRGGIDFFFVDSRDGDTFPCGYRGNENLGPLADLDVAARPHGATPCHQCDWECFRDPSELFGPLLDAFNRPGAALARLVRDPNHRRLWWQDLHYYLACGMFDGRRPPDYGRMARSAAHASPAPAAGFAGSAAPQAA